MPRSSRTRLAVVTAPHTALASDSMLPPARGDGAPSVDAASDAPAIMLARRLGASVGGTAAAADGNAFDGAGHAAIGAAGNARLAAGAVAG
eukprot:6456329-Prymnesium_polylepis.2